MTACDAAYGSRPDEYTFAATDVPISLSRHAVERFQERFRPGLGLETAERELELMVLHGEISSHPPAWLVGRMHSTAAFYLILGDLVLPLEPCRRDREGLSALSALARGSLSPPARERRNQRRKQRRGHMSASNARRYAAGGVAR